MPAIIIQSSVLTHVLPPRPRQNIEDGIFSLCVWDLSFPNFEGSVHHRVHRDDSSLPVLRLLECDFPPLEIDLVPQESFPVLL